MKTRRSCAIARMIYPTPAAITLLASAQPAFDARLLRPPCFSSRVERSLLRGGELSCAMAIGGGGAESRGHERHQRHEVLRNPLVSVSTHRLGYAQRPAMSRTMTRAILTLDGRPVDNGSIRVYPDERANGVRFGSGMTHAPHQQHEPRVAWNRDSELSLQGRALVVSREGIEPSTRRLRAMRRVSCGVRLAPRCENCRANPSGGVRTIRPVPVVRVSDWVSGRPTVHNPLANQEPAKRHVR